MVQRSLRHDLPVLLFLATIYVLLGKFSLQFAIPPGNASAIWPAAGFAVASCLLYGYRAWIAVWVGAAIVNAGTAVSFNAAMLIGFGNTLEALAAAWLINRYIAVRNGFSHNEDVFKFVCIAFFASLIASVIGPSAMLADGTIAMQVFPPQWLTWMLGDLTGIAIVTPAILAWKSDRHRSLDRRKLAELLLFMLAFGVCTTFVFTLSAAPLFFLFLPLMMWFAFRFSQSEVTKLNIVLAIAVVWATLHRMGPLAALPLNTGLLILQVFVSVLGISGLAIAVAVDERRNAIRNLKKMQDELESLVEQRTFQLTATASALRRDIEVRKQIQAQLEAKEKQLEEAQRLSHLGSWTWDPVHDLLVISDEMARIYGVPPAERDALNYEKYLTYIPPEERYLVDLVIRQALSTKASFSYEHHVIRPDGIVRHLRCRGKTESDLDGNPLCLYGTAHDLTEEKALERNLRDAEELYRKLVEFFPDAIYLLRAGRFTFSNSAGIKLIGAPNPDHLVGQPILDAIAPNSRQIISQILHRHNYGQHSPIEAQLLAANGTAVDIDFSATSFNLADKHDTLVVVRDISERKKAELQIHHLAHHDSLTGLANRLLFKERAEHAIAKSRRIKQPLAILFIDLDRFKSINDTSGHSAGDQVLRECAQRLHACLRDSDTVARAGGDEFLVLIESVADSLQVPIIANKIIAAMRMPFHVAGREYTIGASIGISTAPDDGEDIESLIRHADIAMYRAKTEGKGHYCYYSASMAQQSLERHAMEEALRRALERNELVLHFQPKFNLRTGHVTGAEALIRWQHPGRGLLPPSHFISLAEDLGLIGDIGLWAIREVCRHRRDWQKQGLHHVRIAVNTAYSQFADKDFCSHIQAALAEFELGPGALELELTETMVMQNAEQLMTTLKQLRKLGVHLSVDDFGTGYSSLAYLKRLPVDSVKVDQSFIRDLPNDSEDVAITRAVLALVHSLKRSVVAEGVETHEQLRFLIENDCDEVQGFYFSTALPAADFTRYLAQEKSIAV